VVSVLSDRRRGGLTFVSSIASSSFAYVVTETVVVSVLKLSLYLLLQVDLLVALSFLSLRGAGLAHAERARLARRACMGAAMGAAVSRAAAKRARITSGLQFGRWTVYVRRGRRRGIIAEESGRSAAW
jgi:hypothetical protein